MFLFAIGFVLGAFCAIVFITWVLGFGGEED